MVKYEHLNEFKFAKELKTSIPDQELEKHIAPYQDYPSLKDNKLGACNFGEGERFRDTKPLYGEVAKKRSAIDYHDKIYM